MATVGVAAYSQIQAKTRAMYSRMLSPSTWDALVHAQDFDAVLAVLAKTVYGEYLNLDRNVLTPRRAAYQIKWHLSKSYEKLIRLAPQPGRELLLQLWRLYEVHNLKAALRGIEAGVSWSQVLFLLAPMTRAMLLTPSVAERMVQTGDVARAIRLIRRTPYYDPLAHALERYREERNLFPLEVALDRYYYYALWRIVHQFKGLDRQWALRLVGRMIDATNLLWAIRYRLYHHLSEEEIINYTLPFGYRLRDADIRAIAAGEDITPVIGRAFPEVARGEMEQAIARLPALELALDRVLVAAGRAAFVQNPFHIGLPVAYLLLTGYEIRDLVVIIEAKASGIAAETFAPLLTLRASLEARQDAPGDL